MKPSDVGIRYVTVGGDGDGLSWATAMGSVAVAVQSLPTVGAGGQLRHEGVVNVAGGEIDETEPVEFNSGLTFNGVGTSKQTGTVIRRCHDGPLFESTFDDWNHHLIMRDIRLDGNKVTYPAVANLIELRNGGFNTALYNVMFQNATGFGITLGQAVNFYLYNCSGAGCDAGWLRLNLHQTANLANLGIYGAQVDDCGPAVIHIEDRSGGDANNVMVYGLETEATQPGIHESVIRIDTVDSNNPLYVTVDGISAWRSGSAGEGEAVCYRTGTGSTPRWTFRQVHGSGYGLAFRDETLDVESSGNHLVQAIWPDDGYVIV